MFKIALRGLAAHKRRVLGTCSAVVLGVAFLAGTLVLGDSLRAGFDDAFAQANAGTDLAVRGVATIDAGELAPRRPVAASLVDDLAAVDGVARAMPSIEGIGQLAGADGEPVGGNGAPTLARNWMDDPKLNPYRIAEGRVPAASGEVAIDRGSAEAGNLAVGDSTVVRTPQPVEVTVVGIATFGTEDNVGAGSTFFTLDDARRHLLGGAEQVSSVLLAAEPGVEADALLHEVRPLLGAGVEALTGTALTAEQVAGIETDFLGFFETFLLVFTGIALMVATFSIYNTFSVVLAQRSRESALLRAVGASRGQVLTSVGAEAVVIGAVASSLGVVAGIALAAGLARLADGAGLGLPADDLVISANAVVVSLAVGLVVTVVASLAPALRASKVAPLAALREVAIDRSGASRARAIAGGIVTAGGVALVLGVAPSGDDQAALVPVALGAVVTLAGMVVLGPTAARVGARALGAPLPALRGVAGALARQNAQRDPKRTASTASALMLGVGVVTLFTVFAASIKATINDSVASSLATDLVVNTDGFSGAGLAPEVAEEIGSLPGVETAAGLGFGLARIDGIDGAFSVSDPALLADVLDLDVAAGSVEDLSTSELAVSSDTAESKGWSLGTAVPVDFPDGASTELTVGAIYESADIVGPYLVPTAVQRPHATQAADTAVLVTLAEEADVASVRTAIEDVVAPYGAPPVLDRDEYVASIVGQIDQLLTIVYVLLALSILIALMGIANTLALSIHERTRELGLLRAVGQTRGQLRSMVRWESVLIAAFATLGGAGLGLFLGWGLVRGVTAEAGYGTFDVPAGPLAVVLVVGALAGVLAAVRPARRAARLDVLAAVTTE